jgi:hypothetical protein
MIAKVIKLNNTYNATVKQLRTEHTWRDYVCNCEGKSSHWEWITGGDDRPRYPIPELVDYQSPTSKRIYKAKYVQIKSTYAKSSCAGVTVYIPTQKGVRQGKTIAFLLASKG